MTATAAAIKRLDDLFQNIRLENDALKNGTRKKSKEGGAHHERVHFNPIVVTKDCDIHGRRSIASSGGNGRSAIGPRRESMPAGLNAIPVRRRGQGMVLGSPNRDSLCHPAGYASTLRKEPLSAFGSTNSLRRGGEIAARKEAFSTLNNAASKRDAYAPVGANGAKKELNGGFKRDYCVDKGMGKGSSSSLTRRFSTDSLDSIRRNSWDTNRRESSGSSAGFDDPIWEENNLDEVGGFFARLGIVETTDRSEASNSQKKSKILLKKKILWRRKCVRRAIFRNIEVRVEGRFHRRR